VIEQDGRQGLNMTSIHSVLQMKGHSLKNIEGAVSMGVMSLENLSLFRDRENVGLNKTMIFTSLQVHIFSQYRWVC
jgi:hypothetical protein